MNQLNVHPGARVPFNWDDLGWMQDSVLEAFKGLLSAFDIAENLSFRISGATVTVAGLNYASTEGWLSFKGELCYVPIHNITITAGQNVYWKVEQIANPAGGKIDSNGDPVDMYLYRVAKLEAVLGHSATRMPFDAPYLNQKISDKIGYSTFSTALNQAWQLYDSPTISTDWVDFALVSSSSAYKLIGKTMHLNLVVVFTHNGSQSYVDIKLPASKQMEKAQLFTGILKNNANTDYFTILGSRSPVGDDYIRIEVLDATSSFIENKLILNCTFGIK
jgi:hypothetical protein